MGKKNRYPSKKDDHIENIPVKLKKKSVFSGIAIGNHGSAYMVVVFLLGW